MSFPFYEAVHSAASGLPLLGTLGSYELAMRLQRRCRNCALANPVLIAIATVTLGNYLLDEPVADYSLAVHPLIFLLGPATVALAVPLYRRIDKIKQACPAVLVTVVIGTVLATGSAVGAAVLHGAPPIVLDSLATKSATAAIAIAVSPEIGGDPALAAGFTVIPGVFGAVVCLWAFDIVGIHDPRARGLATGIAAHGIGTARLLSQPEEASAFSGPAMGLTALLVGLCLPLLYHWFWH